jgi:hypothetical protein
MRTQHASLFTLREFDRPRHRLTTNHAPSIHNASQANRLPSRRAGATVVESAIALSLMFCVLFTLFDLGLLAFQSNMLSLAARRLARESIVRGSGVDPTGAWGPTAVSMNANDSSSIGQTVKPYCVAMTPMNVAIQIIWLDGTNLVDDRVMTSLSYQRAPLTPATVWMGTINLKANATMKIVH